MLTDTHYSRSARPSKRNGFSLIELLIVVAIILIVAAIAIPNFLKARMAANEASAVSSIHAINTSQITYSSVFPAMGFSANLSNLGPGGACDTPTNTCLIDANLASGTKSGYNFTYAAIGAVPYQSYTLNADPVTRGITGQRSFYSDQYNSTHYNQSTTAKSTDPALQ